MSSEKWKLNSEQKELVVGWIAEFPSNRAVLAKCKAADFPELTSEAIRYYRRRYDKDLAEIREKRRSEALEGGWAKLEVRVAQYQAMLDDWSTRKPQGKEEADMILKASRQLAEEVGAIRPRVVGMVFDSPRTMQALMDGIDGD